MLNCVSFLGCGWLGYPTALNLIRKNYILKGSSTSPEKIALFKKSRIQPFLIDIKPPYVMNRQDAFFDSDILVLTLPFKRTFNPPEQYLEQVQAITNVIARSNIKWVIFTSSTSVYANCNGPVSENDRKFSRDERAQVLLGVEDFLLNHKSFDTTVIRFGGLYGGTRQLGRFLTGKRGLKNGDAPVNLIHLEDAVGLITHIIEGEHKNLIVNGVTDGHPTREELYHKEAKKLGIQPPQFDPPVKTTYKLVDNTFAKNGLGYSFKVCL